MRIYLARHGKAFEKEVDPERPLTPEGVREVERVGMLLSGAGLAVPAVWHSGKARARQTAEVLAGYAAKDARLYARDDLSPKDDVKPIAAELRRRGENVMVVGHLPFLSKLASFLLTGDSDVEIVGLPSAGVVCLERGDRDTWQIIWLVTPEVSPSRERMVT